MMNKVICRSLVTIIVLACYGQAQTLKKVASIDLPGPKGQRFDFLTMDDEDHWLLSAHLGPGILYVIDVQTNKLARLFDVLCTLLLVVFLMGLASYSTVLWIMQ